MSGPTVKAKNGRESEHAGGEIDRQRDEGQADERTRKRTCKHRQRYTRTRRRASIDAGNEAWTSVFGVLRHGRDEDMSLVRRMGAQRSERR